MYRWFLWQLFRDITIDVSVVMETGKTGLCIDDFLWQLFRDMTIVVSVVMETGKTGLGIDDYLRQLFRDITIGALFALETGNWGLNEDEYLWQLIGGITNDTSLHFYVTYTVFHLTSRISLQLKLDDFHEFWEICSLASFSHFVKLLSSVQV